MARHYTDQLATISGGYRVNTSIPLDTRIIIDKFNDLLLEDTWKVGDASSCYKGIVVTVIGDGEGSHSDKKSGVYYFTGGSNEYTDASKWVRLSASSAGGGAISAFGTTTTLTAGTATLTSTITPSEGEAKSASFGLVAGSFITLGHEATPENNNVSFGVNAHTSEDAKWSATDSSDNYLVTEKAVYQYVNDSLKLTDAMVYMGVVTPNETSGSAPTWPASIDWTKGAKGWTFKVNGAGYIFDVPVESGDMVIVNDNLTTAPVKAQLDFIQTNVDFGVKQYQVAKNSKDLVNGGIVVASGSGIETMAKPTVGEGESVTAGDYYMTVNNDGVVTWQKTAKLTISDDGDEDDKVEYEYTPGGENKNITVHSLTFHNEARGNEDTSHDSVYNPLTGAATERLDIFVWETFTFPVTE